MRKNNQNDDNDSWHEDFFSLLHIAKEQRNDEREKTVRSKSGR